MVHSKLYFGFFPAENTNDLYYYIILCTNCTHTKLTTIKLNKFEFIRNAPSQQIQSDHDNNNNNNGADFQGYYCSHSQQIKFQTRKMFIIAIAIKKMGEQSTSYYYRTARFTEQFIFMSKCIVWKLNENKFCVLPELNVTLTHPQYTYFYMHSNVKGTTASIRLVYFAIKKYIFFILGFLGLKTYYQFRTFFPHRSKIKKRTLEAWADVSDAWKSYSSWMRTMFQICSVAYWTLYTLN